MTYNQGVSLLQQVTKDRIINCDLQSVLDYFIEDSPLERMKSSQPFYKHFLGERKCGCPTFEENSLKPPQDILSFIRKTWKRVIS